MGKDLAIKVENVSFEVKKGEFLTKNDTIK